MVVLSSHAWSFFISMYYRMYCIHISHILNLKKNQITQETFTCTHKSFNIVCLGKQILLHLKLKTQAHTQRKFQMCIAFTLKETKTK